MRTVVVAVGAAILDIGRHGAGRSGLNDDRAVVNDGGFFRVATAGGKGQSEKAKAAHSSNDFHKKLRSEVKR